MTQIQSKSMEYSNVHIGVDVHVEGARLTVCREELARRRKEGKCYHPASHPGELDDSFSSAANNSLIELVYCK